MNERLAKIDLGILFSSLLLIGLGVVLVYSSSFAVAQTRFGGADFFLERQVIRVGIALAAFLVFVNIDYHLWGRLAVAGYGLAILLLLIVLALPDAMAVNGAKRWISIGSVRFQVSEFARMALIVFIARECQRRGEKLGEWKQFAFLMSAVVAMGFLVLLEPDFSTAVIITGIGMMMLYTAGARFFHLAGVILAVLPAALFGLIAMPYRRERVISFFNGNGGQDAVGYQVRQSLIGLGNGGFFGVGLGQGRQKLFYLPEPHTDFAFSILGEEIGFVGLLVIFIVFAFMICRGIRIALRAPDLLGQLMAFGFTLVLAVYVIIHASVNVGLMPTTGVPLPFLSYGGMSLIFTMSSIGILLNISSQVTAPKPTTVKHQRDRLSRRPGR